MYRLPLLHENRLSVHLHRIQKSKNRRHDVHRLRIVPADVPPWGDRGVSAGVREKNGERGWNEVEGLYLRDCRFSLRFLSKNTYHMR